MIDALSQVGAGSRTYLKNVLPRLENRDDGIQYFVLWPANRNLPPNLLESDQLKIIPIHIPQKPAVIRFLYQQLVIPFLARDMDVLYAPVDIAPIFTPCPVLLAIRNPNPFNRLERSIYKKLYYSLKRLIIKFSAYQSTHIIYVSEHSQAHINFMLDIHPDKTSVNYHGVDIDKFSVSDENKLMKPGPINDFDSYLLCVSTITSHKNFETLLEAYGMLPESLRDRYPLIIVGRIAARTYYQQLTSIIDENQITTHVRFLGEQPYRDIERYYRGASLYILPSYLETFGHTLVEAMAAGVPVIASQVSALPEIVGKGGVFFDPDDPGELSGRMESILINKTLADDLISRGKCRAKDFSWDRNTEKLITLLREIAP